MVKKTALLDPQGQMGLRLSEKVREAFLKTYKTVLCTAHGTVLKEYVLVPKKLFMDNKKMSPYLKMNVDYINSLKPKSK